MRPDALAFIPKVSSSGTCMQFHAMCILYRTYIMELELLSSLDAPLQRPPLLNSPYILFWPYAVRLSTEPYATAQTSYY